MTIFTYRDERRLFALISIIIVAAALALLQINAQRTGSVSPIATVTSSIFGFAQTAVSAAIGGARDARHHGRLVAASRERERSSARAQPAADRRERAASRAGGRLCRRDRRAAGRQSLPRRRGARHRLPAGERISRRDDRQRLSRRCARETRASSRRTASSAASPPSLLSPAPSSSLRITRAASRWSCSADAGGASPAETSASVVVEYIPQDAPLRVGDVVVTGEGRSFRSGVPIGTVTAIERGDATLYQTAVLKTSVDLGALDRVVVVSQ